MAPRHAALADELRRRIAAKVLAVGDPLPSEAALGAEFGVARGTVRQAVGALRAEGLVGGGPGRPPVVRAQAPGQPFETFLSFTRWAEQVGRRPGQRTIEVARRGASIHAADALGLDAGEPVVELVRLRTLDGDPAMVERSTFVLDLGRLLFDIDPDAGSVYDALRAHGADLAAARHTFDAVAADDVDALLLGVAPGAPLLRERRRVTDATGRPMEYADDRYRPDVVTFTIDNTAADGSSVARSSRVDDRPSRPSRPARRRTATRRKEQRAP